MNAASCSRKILPVSGTEDRILGRDERCCYGLGIRAWCSRCLQAYRLDAMGSKKIFYRQQTHAMKRVETLEQASVFSPQICILG